MATGIPELGMPPLDPIHLELIDFKFFNMTIEFVDVDMEGFKTFTLEKSTVDRTGRSWDIELSIPRGGGGCLQDVRLHPPQPRPRLLH